MNGEWIDARQPPAATAAKAPVALRLRKVVFSEGATKFSAPADAGSDSDLSDDTEDEINGIRAPSTVGGGAVEDPAVGAEQETRPGDALRRYAKALLHAAKAGKRRLDIQLMTDLQDLNLVGDVTGLRTRPMASGKPRILLGGYLQPHQTAGLRWLLAGRATGLGGQILADDMGLGKTIQVIALFAQLLEWLVDDKAGGAVDDRAKLMLNAMAEGGPLPRLADKEKEEEGDDFAMASAVAAKRAPAGSIKDAIASLRSEMGGAGAEAQGPQAGKAPHVRPDKYTDESFLDINQTLNVLSRGSAGPHLVVAPSSVLANWARECAKWCGFLRVAMYSGKQADREALKADLRSYNVVITSYSVLERDEAARPLLRVSWDLLVLDEAHSAKNSDSAKYGRILDLRASHRVLLTGTPVQNNMAELMSLIVLLSPDFMSTTLLSKDGPGRRFAVTHGDEYVENEEAGGESRQAAALVGAMQKEVDGLVRAARSRGKGGAAGAGAGARGGVREPAARQEQSVESLLSVFVLRRVKDDLVLGLPTKTRVTAWVSLTPTAAGVVATLTRVLLALLAPDTALARIVRAAHCAGDNCEMKDGRDGEAVVSWAYTSPPSCVGSLAGVLVTASGEVIAGPGAAGKLLMMLRKAAIHPLLLRLRYSDATVLDMARVIHDEEQQGSKGKRLKLSLEPHPLLDASAQPAAALDDSAFLRAVSAAHPVLDKSALLAWAQGDKALMSTATQLLAASDAEIDGGWLADYPSLAAFRLPQAAYEDSAKVAWLRSLMATLSQGSRVLLFSQFTDALDVMQFVLEAWKEPYSRLDGSTKVGDRQGIIDVWSASSKRLMLLSTRAGGVGINLTAADTVVFLDCDWNPTNDAQAEDRAYRIGQTRPVTVHRVLAKGTLELHMAGVAESKTELASALMGLTLS
jgi:SNF2 family DNA or RNA helicase